MTLALRKLTPKRLGSSKSKKGGAEPILSHLRKAFRFTAKDFARLTGFSERAIAGWEAGKPIGAPARRRLLEIRRLLRSLAELVSTDAIPIWVHTPNKAFDGLKPLEVIERGEIDRLWRMIYFLESGVPV